MKRHPLSTVFGLTFLLLQLSVAHSQDLEPRAYTNTPVGLNFLIAGYVYADGKMAFDPSLSIVDAQFRTNIAILAYARSFEVFGNSAKFDVVLPYSSFSGYGLVNGQTREREMSGLNDPRFRFSVNFFGAPALSMREFKNYRQDLIVGASLQVSVPLGQYDDSKLINLGTNRWSFKPELGISKAWGPWRIEVAPSVILYTDNTDFFNGHTFSQAPIYAVQTHIIHNFQYGIWLGLSGTYFTGGRTSVDGVKGDNDQTNTRLGLTLSLPVDKQNSLKVYSSIGTSTRTGSEASLVGVAWQHRWGDDY